MRSIIPAIPLISLLLAGCVRTQTVIVPPGQPIRLLTPMVVPGKASASEAAKGQWIVNDAPVSLPAGAYVVVLPLTQPSSTQP
jgi:hypothetical protein